ncbi:MAG: UDP-3-O-(3-hydroxymyristoyl)glucosamine N-acyltransferase, partial [Hymenobacter sp.]
LLQGQVEGNPAVTVTDFGKIEEAGPQQLAFLANPKYEEYLYITLASIVIVNESLQLKQAVAATLIRVPNAYTAFATLLEMYQQMQQQQLTGIQQPSYIDASARLSEQVYVGAFAYIGKEALVGKGAKIYPQVFIGDGVQVGEGAVLHPGVKVYHQCKIGKGVIVHAGAVIGSDGFGFAPQADGSFKKVPQTGNVVLEDYVEVGANTTIDRATIGSTIIQAGAKIDNLVQIAHNVVIGNNTVIAAQAGISGSTHLGKNSMVGGQAGIVGHLQIADGARINAQSGVSKSIKSPNATVTGSPAFDYTSALRSQAVTRNLPELEKRIIELENLVKALIEKK